MAETHCYECDARTLCAKCADALTRPAIEAACGRCGFPREAHGRYAHSPRICIQYITPESYLNPSFGAARRAATPPSESAT